MKPARFLIDTHVLIWAITDASLLPPRVRKFLLDESHELVLSTASIWEIQLKRRAGKLSLPADPAFLHEHIQELGIAEVLPILPAHAYRVLALPQTHKDPFDCLLAAQCLAEGLGIVSADQAFTSLGVRRVW